MGSGCKHCVAVFKVRENPHFCSFGTLFVVEGKRFSATVLKALQRSQTLFQDKSILLKLSDIPEEGTPLSASLVDLFWWLSGPHHTSGGSWAHPGGFTPAGPCSPHPHPHGLGGETHSPPPIETNACLFERKFAKERKHLFSRQTQPYDPTDGKMPRKEENFAFSWEDSGGEGGEL